ncbi:MAG: SHOCT domain-containing protein [Thaumarchaeota archaeon]|nr:SHOCT domain-containing protein [Nitrososphaerota archaeon]
MVSIPSLAGLGHGRRSGFARWVFAGILILVLLGIFAASLAFTGWLSYVGSGPYFGRGFFFFPFGFFFVILVVFFAFRLLFWGWGGHWNRGYYRTGYGGGSALEILNQRYARGEITKDQYEQMKRDIQQTS